MVEDLSPDQRLGPENGGGIHAPMGCGKALALGRDVRTIHHIELVCWWSLECHENEV